MPARCLMLDWFTSSAVLMGRKFSVQSKFMIPKPISGHTGPPYAMGGYDDQDTLSSVECLDPQRLLPGWKMVAPMMSQRSNFATASIEEEIQVIGGYRPGGVFKECETYNPETNTWRPSAPLAKGQSAVAAITISTLPEGHSIPIR